MTFTKTFGFVLLIATLFFVSHAQAQALVPVTYMAAVGAIPNGTVSGASGIFTTTISGNSATFTLQVRNMVNLTMAHIHQVNSTLPIIGLVPDAPGAGPVVLDAPLTFSGYQTFGGSYNSSSIYTSTAPKGYTWSDLLADIANGNAYVNVHSVKYPAGEIAGTLIPAPKSFGTKTVVGLTLLMALLL